MAEQMVPARLQIGNRIFDLGEVAASFEEAPFERFEGLIEGGKKCEFPEVGDVVVKEREKALEDLVFQGKATKTVKLGNKIPVVMETLTGEEQLALDSTTEEVPPPAFAIKKWDLDYEMIRTLAAVIKSLDGQPLGDDRVSREAAILKLPFQMILFLGGEYNRWVAELTMLMHSDTVGDLLRK